MNNNKTSSKAPTPFPNNIPQMTIPANLPPMPNLALWSLLQQQQQAQAMLLQRQKVGQNIPNNRPAVTQTSTSSAHETVSVTTQVPTNNILYPPTRKWQLTFPKGSTLQDSDLQITLSMKIRGEEARMVVAEKLYSSHKYVMLHSITGKKVMQQYPLLVARLYVVDPMNPQDEILKNGKPIVKGASEAAVTKPSEHSTHMQGTMKIQFTDVSYHHEKKYFAFSVKYFDPSNLEQPLMTLTSPAFRVYARKPTIHEGEEEEEATPSKKKKKQTSTKKGTKRSRKQVEEEEQEGQTKEEAPTKLIETKKESLLTSADEPSGPTPTSLVASSEPLDLTQPLAPPLKKLKSSPHFAEFTKKLDELVAMKNELSEDDRKVANEWSLEKLLSVDSEWSMDFLLHGLGVQNQPMPVLFPTAGQQQPTQQSGSHAVEAPQQQVIQQQYVLHNGNPMVMPNEGDISFDSCLLTF
jgi:hypothetical protein